MEKKISRRGFIAIGAGAGAALMSSRAIGGQIGTDAVVPKRAFGNSGVKISQLCLGGGSFGNTDSQSLLDEALNCGIDCWEIVSFTGNAYSEYFKMHPRIREKVFLSGKVYSTDPSIMQNQLDQMLYENGTSYVDYLAVHVIDNIKALTDNVKNWANKVKMQNKIRYFGFCTHKDMAKCLSDGAELGWIDGIQTVYNHRLQSIKSMEDALQKCHEKGIGIFTIKSMGLTVQQKAELNKLEPGEKELNSLLALHNVSFEQVKLKAIWQNPNVTSICSLMPDVRILKSNSLAAMDEQLFDPEIKRLLTEYSDSTGQYFCRRCGLCDTANADRIPISDMMEMLMYSRGYGKFEPMLKKFEKIPIEIRNRINSSDYSGAEKICPQRMQIGQLMKEAYMEFSKRKE